MTTKCLEYKESSLAAVDPASLFFVSFSHGFLGINGLNAGSRKWDQNHPLDHSKKDKVEEQLEYITWGLSDGN